MTTVTYKIKSLFVDRPEIQRAIEKANKRALPKAGAHTRRRAIQSLRRRKKPSTAGSPPSVHSDSKVANLRNILFGFDPSRGSMLVGPVKLNGRSSFGPQLNGTVPETHEFGGSGRVKVGLEARAAGKKRFRKNDPRRHDPTEWRILRREPRPGQPVKTVTAHWSQRAFMGPALRAEAPNFPSLYFGQIHG